MAANTEDFVIVGAQSSDANEHISKPALSFWQDAWRRLKLNKLAVVSMWFLVIILAFAVLSNIFVPHKAANSFNSDKLFPIRHALFAISVRRRRVARRLDLTIPTRNW